MKKLWMKSAALLACAAFAFSAGCGPAGGTSQNSDGSGTSASDGTGGEGPSSESIGYVRAALEQLSASESATISVTAAMTQTMTAEGQTMSQSAAVDAEIVIAAADSGLNMLIDYTVKPEGGESFSSSVYVIDGAMYTYDEEGFYVLNPSSVDFSALSALAGLDFGAEESGIAEMLALLLDEYGTVEEGKANVSLSYDAAVPINAVIALINGIDEEKTTLETAINTLLLFLGADVTVGEILDEVKPFGAMKLPQAVAALDTYLKDFGVSVQQIKDAVVSVPAVADMLDRAVEEGQLTESLAELIRTGTAEQLLAALQLDEMTVNQLIQMIFMDSSEPAEAFDLAAVIDEQLKPMLKNTTLAQNNIYLPDLDGTAFSEASASAELVIGEKIEKMDLGVQFDMTQTQTMSPEPDSDAEEVVVTQGIAADISVSVAFSEESVSIALPEDAVVVYPVWQIGWEGYSEEAAESYITFFPPEYSEGEFVGEGTVTLVDGAGSEANYSFVYELMPQDTSGEEIPVAVTVTSAYFYTPEGDAQYEGESLAALLGGSASLEVKLFPPVYSGSGVAMAMVDLTMFPLFADAE